MEAVEAILTDWCERILAALTGQMRTGARIAGKTLRGSKRQGASHSHLVAAYAADLGMVLAQQGVDDKTNELGVLDDFLLPVNENQPLTHQAIANWFEHPAPYDWPKGEARVCEKQHGRLTQWPIETSTALNDYLEWPGLAQVFKITCQVTFPKTGQTRMHTRYAIPSLTPQQASPADLLAFTRHHWAIENSLHWVRDVTFAEDRSTLRVGYPSGDGAVAA